MFSVKGEGKLLDVYIKFKLKFSAIIYGRGLMICFNVFVKFLVLSLKFKFKIYVQGLEQI